VLLNARFPVQLCLVLVHHLVINKN
jgi:hypothetical protein